MSRLSELRRWVNTKRVVQGILNTNTVPGVFVHVEPGGYLEGAQWAHVRMSPLQETTAHLTQDELSSAVEEENDIELLRHFLEIERKEGRRADIMKLFEDRLEILSKQSGNLDSKRADHPSQNEPPYKSWHEIEIVFISDERVQINAAGQTKTLNYAEFGFEDHRNQIPKRAWITLQSFAKHEGTIRQPTSKEQKWTMIEKRMQEIRKVLRKYFLLSDDPLPFVRGIGYQARFKIRRSRSYDT